MNKVELLAPAGDFSCLKAAIEAGCDAVYIGGKLFGARAFSSNFTDDEIIKAINYAHLLSNEKSDPFVNVHFWLVPVEGTTSPDLLDFDVKEYLKSFNPKDELPKILSYNNKLKNYLKEIDLVKQDDELTARLENLKNKRKKMNIQDDNEIDR